MGGILSAGRSPGWAWPASKEERVHGAAERGAVAAEDGLRAGGEGWEGRLRAEGFWGGTEHFPAAPSSSRGGAGAKRGHVGVTRRVSLSGAVTTLSGHRVCGSCGTEDRRHCPQHSWGHPGVSREACSQQPRGGKSAMSGRPPQEAARCVGLVCPSVPAHGAGTPGPGQQELRSPVSWGGVTGTQAGRAPWGRAAERGEDSGLWGPCTGKTGDRTACDSEAPFSPLASVPPAARRSHLTPSGSHKAPTRGWAPHLLPQAQTISTAPRWLQVWPLGQNRGPESGDSGVSMGIRVQARRGAPP